MNLVQVANGFSGVYFEDGLCAWDQAASALIITEADGAVCDLHDDVPYDLNWRCMIAACSNKLANDVFHLRRH